MLDNNGISVNRGSCKLCWNAVRYLCMTTGVVKNHAVSAHVRVEGCVTLVVIVFFTKGVEVIELGVLAITHFHVFGVDRHDWSARRTALIFGFLWLSEVLLTVAVMNSMRIERNVWVLELVVVRIEGIELVVAHEVWVRLLAVLRLRSHHFRHLLRLRLRALHLRAHLRTLHLRAHLRTLHLRAHLRTLHLRHLLRALHLWALHLWALHLLSLLRSMHFMHIAHLLLKAEVFSWEVADKHIIVRVAIVRDQSTSIVVTSKLDLRRVNLINGSVDALTIMLDDGGVGIDSCCSDLRVCAGCNCNVSTNILEGEAVGAELRTLLRRLAPSPLLLHGDFLRAERLACGVDRRKLSNFFNARRKDARLEVLRERVLEANQLVSASDDLGAWSDHVGGERELLAVENKGVPVVIHLMLAVGTVIEETLTLL